MQNQQNFTEETQTETKPVDKKERPQEVSGIQIDTSLKIFDPKSGEVFLEGRG